MDFRSEKNSLKKKIGNGSFLHIDTRLMVTPLYARHGHKNSVQVPFPSSQTSHFLRSDPRMSIGEGFVAGFAVRAGRRCEAAPPGRKEWSIWMTSIYNLL